MSGHEKGLRRPVCKINPLTVKIRLEVIWDTLIGGCSRSHYQIWRSWARALLVAVVPRGHGQRELARFSNWPNEGSGRRGIDGPRWRNSRQESDGLDKIATNVPGPQEGFPTAAGWCFLYTRGPWVPGFSACLLSSGVFRKFRSEDRIGSQPDCNPLQMYHVRNSFLQGFRPKVWVMSSEIFLRSTRRLRKFDSG